MRVTSTSYVEKGVVCLSIVKLSMTLMIVEQAFSRNEMSYFMKQRCLTIISSKPKLMLSTHDKSMKGSRRNVTLISNC